MLSKSMLVFAGLAAFAASAPTPVRPPVPAGFTGGRAFNNDVRNALAPQKRSIDLDDYETLVAEIPGYRRRYAALGKRDDHEDDEEDCDDTPEPPTSPGGDDDDDCDSEGGDDDDDDDCDSEGGDDDDDDCDSEGGDDSDDEGNDDDCVEPDNDDDDDDEPPVSGGGGSAPEPNPNENSGSGDCKKQYTVKSGDNCSKVATDNSITLAQFYKWNPSLDSECMNLELGQEYCVEM